MFEHRQSSTKGCSEENHSLVLAAGFPLGQVEVCAYWDEHARFVDDLFDRGLIMLVGPFVPEGSGALVILNVDSVEEARAIYANDPWAHQDILLTADAKEWTIFLDGRKNP